MKPNHENVSVETSDNVAIVRYSNQPSGLMTRKGAELLLNALQPLTEDTSVNAVVLTGGDEDVFIRHASVGQIIRAAEALRQEQVPRDIFSTTAYFHLLQLLDNSPKPVIAAINGTCMGGGFEIALGCTYRIASQQVQHIGLPEIKLGIFPGSGGTQRLRDLLGVHHARAFILRGRVVNATTALEIGLVDEVAPSALDQAVVVARELAARSPAAIRSILQLTKSNPDSRATGLMDEARVFADLLLEDDVGIDIMIRFEEQGLLLNELE
ncbi:enoyl-CoA hydratase/isomerase family protein [Parahaliea maris]|uniref:Enoyl-CoA hydratase/isomerase family protein n=1 Tax=Parahaliea maris TaxID=2716870 RepID=A0A5C9A5H2_9GAMM|nr:enoyl-CoA hydratase/isomerase family protein [Parahaliea maris]TXS95274.1 enoyl-CoA hydratase/isomerase family protein [Parahaliea maris]